MYFALYFSRDKQLAQQVLEKRLNLENLRRRNGDMDIEEEVGTGIINGFHYVNGSGETSNSITTSNSSSIRNSKINSSNSIDIKINNSNNKDSMSTTHSTTSSSVTNNSSVTLTNNSKTSQISLVDQHGPSKFSGSLLFFLLLYIPKL